jgi:hypothetical protein
MAQEQSADSLIRITFIATMIAAAIVIAVAFFWCIV